MARLNALSTSASLVALIREVTFSFSARAQLAMFVELGKLAAIWLQIEAAGPSVR